MQSSDRKSIFVANNRTRHRNLMPEFDAPPRASRFGQEMVATGWGKTFMQIYDLRKGAAPETDTSHKNA